MTLVNGEEDVLIPLGGPAKVILFSNNQPMFPKFKKEEHGDEVSGKNK